MDSPQVAYGDPGLQVGHASSQPLQHHPQPYDHSPSERQTKPGEEYKNSAKSNKILGVQRQTFWFIVVLSVVLIAAAVGGGIGGSIAVQNVKDHAASNYQATETITVLASSQAAASESPSASPTTTASSIAPYIPPHPSTVARIDNACPLSSTPLASYKGDIYRCAEKTSYTGNELGGFVAYTLQACIDACSTMNEMATPRDKCVAVVLNSDLKGSYLTNHGANCWLKSATTNFGSHENGTTATLCTSSPCT